MFVLLVIPHSRDWNLFMSRPDAARSAELDSDRRTAGACLAARDCVRADARALEPLFRLGFASPQYARIEGTGVGAIRYCVFSTGPFVEPITAWSRTGAWHST